MNVVTASLASLSLGPQVSAGDLGVVPLLAPAERRQSRPFYDTLKAAIAAGRVRVTEISEDGSVPELSVVNEGPRPVLLVDGDELIGARQNRIINMTILVRAGTTLRIPVSCVEAGRWSYRSREFRSADRKLHASGRRDKLAQVNTSLRHSSSRMADQGAVWDDIERKSARLGAHSVTHAAAAMFESRQTTLESFIAALHPHPDQVGGLFLVRGKVCGLDAFDHPETWAREMAGLVRSYGLDALDPSLPSPRQVDSAAAFLEDVGRSPIEQFPALGLGADLRLHGTGVVGGALVVDDAVVHLVAFPAEPGARTVRRRTPSAF